MMAQRSTGTPLAPEVSISTRSRPPAPSWSSGLENRHLGVRNLSRRDPGNKMSLLRPLWAAPINLVAVCCAGSASIGGKMQAESTQQEDDRRCTQNCDRTCNASLRLRTFRELTGQSILAKRSFSASGNLENGARFLNRGARRSRSFRNPRMLTRLLQSPETRLAGRADSSCPITVQSSDSAQHKIVEEGLSRGGHCHLKRDSSGRSAGCLPLESSRLRALTGHELPNSQAGFHRSI